MPKPKKASASQKELTLVKASDWSSWLKANHDKEPGAWVVSPEKTTNEQTLTYEEALDIALAYGWIDISIRKIEKKRFGRKFTPRRAESNWTQGNIDRAEKLIRDGKMREPGLEAYVNRKLGSANPSSNEIGKRTQDFRARYISDQLFFSSRDQNRPLRQRYTERLESPFTTWRCAYIVSSDS